MFPDFKIFPCGKNTEELRRLISELMGRDDIEEIICATDAGREGELPLIVSSLGRDIFCRQGQKSKQPLEHSLTSDKSGIFTSVRDIQL